VAGDLQFTDADGNNIDCSKHDMVRDTVLHLACGSSSENEWTTSLYKKNSVVIQSSFCQCLSSSYLNTFRPVCASSDHASDLRSTPRLAGILMHHRHLPIKL